MASCMNEPCMGQATRNATVRVTGHAANESFPGVRVNQNAKKGDQNFYCVGGGPAII